MRNQSVIAPENQDSATRVACDVRVLQGEDAFRGMGHYTRGLVESLLSLAEGGKEETPLKIALIIDKNRPEPRLANSSLADFIAVSSPTSSSGRLPFPARFRKDPQDLREIKKALSHWGADILHVCSPLHGPFNWKPMDGVKTIATVYDLIPLRDRQHYLDIWPTAARERYEHRLESLSSLDAIVAISQVARRDLAQLTGTPASRIHVAYPALRGIFADRAANQTPNASPRQGGPILAFASLNPSKNTKILLEAFAKVDPALRRKHPLLLMGPEESDLRDFLKAKFEELKIEKEATFLSEPDDARLLESYCQAALFVLPSSSEGFGIPAIEAMACGTPLIASDIPVLREVINGGGVFFSTESPEDLAMAISEILTKPQDSALRAASARRRATEFSWQRSARTVAGLYKELKAARRKKGALGTSKERDKSPAYRGANQE